MRRKLIITGIVGSIIACAFVLGVAVLKGGGTKCVD